MDGKSVIFCSIYFDLNDLKIQDLILKDWWPMGGEKCSKPQTDLHLSFQQILSSKQFQSHPKILKVDVKKASNKLKLQSLMPFQTHFHGDGMLKESSQSLTELYNHARARLQQPQIVLRVLIKLNMLNGKLILETTALHLLRSLSYNVSMKR